MGTIWTRVRLTAAAFSIAALGLTSGAVAAAEAPTPVDSHRSVTDDSAFGAYLWHNEDGWHFRTHGIAEGTRFTARIATNGTIHDVVAVRDEKDDHIVLDGDGRILNLSFATFSGVDGVDFRLDDAANLRVGIKANEQKLPVASIFLGDDGRHPEKNPFKIRLGESRVPKDLRSGYTLLRRHGNLMLLTHNDEASKEYTGTLTSAGTIEVVNLVQPEKDDSVSLSADGHTLNFKFATQEAVDGVVVHVTGSDSVKLSLDTNGTLTPVKDIHIGKKGRSPKANPFDVRV